VSVKWGHSTVVDYFLETGKYERTIVKNCLKLAPNRAVKSVLLKHLNEKEKNPSTISLLCSWFRK